MAKIRLTKNELKKQKNALKRYNQYLPTLLLKKQQLQGEHLKIHNAIEETKEKKAYAEAEVYEWVDVFAENVEIEEIVKLDRIVTTKGNVAGIDIPIFEKAIFDEVEYDLLKTPLWVDYGIASIKEEIIVNAQIEVLEEQERLVAEELRTTTQRVNLFEKIMIPNTSENIRKIQIYLGDMQTAAVVTGKIAKEKILKKELVAKLAVD